MKSACKAVGIVGTSLFAPLLLFSSLTTYSTFSTSLLPSHPHEIIGLPNVGKSTLFNALTSTQVFNCIPFSTYHLSFIFYLYIITIIIAIFILVSLHSLIVFLCFVDYLACTSRGMPTSSQISSIYNTYFVFFLFFFFFFFFFYYFFCFFFFFQQNYPFCTIE